MIFEIVDPSSPTATEAMTAYFAELDNTFPDGFDPGFDPGDALTHDLDEYRHPHGAFIVAIDDGELLACGAIQRHDEVTGEIKRMWVATKARGRGMGAQMLQRLEVEVAALGYHAIVLDTNASLGAAIAMYTSRGYEPIERYNDNPYADLWFRKSLAG